MPSNPFPGLRPFESDEEHLFFGRERDVDALLARLRTSRFMAVVGASGSGKSSLVRSGLIPALVGGFMAGAGSSWRMAVLRPGEDPIGHLAATLSRPDMLGAQDEPESTRTAALEATLRRGPRGLVNAVKYARLPAGHNVLILVDQFEEIFRFRRGRADARDESIAFVRSLLEASAQRDLPIFVVLTMRSDFIGDCMDFPGLPEAINAGLYLVGRMDRDALRTAITGPVAVAGGTIAPRLVSRVLNELGDDQDQLPRVQHALMRTWNHWAAREHDGSPIDVEDYDAIGTLQHALSQHAEEAWGEAVAAVGEHPVEQIFKALTDRHSDPRGVRRPTSVEELVGIAGVPVAEVIRTVDVFRHPSRCFLMPPIAVPLTARSIIDISHESLMRGWPRLVEWARQEAEAADFYLLLSRDAARFAGGRRGLWQQPELGLAVRWRHEAKPTAAWARRYDDRFEQAMAFLDRSLDAHQRAKAEAERARQSILRRTQWAAAVLGILLAAAVTLGIMTLHAQQRAAESLKRAREAVDNSLSSVDMNPNQIGGTGDPAADQLRQELLQKAQVFYNKLATDAPDTEAARHDVATVHMKLGHIKRLREDVDGAEVEYATAIRLLEQLAAASPGSTTYREEIAGAENDRGLVLAARPGRFVDALGAYDRAVTLQEGVLQSEPATSSRAILLAQILDNRGNLLSESQPARAEQDYRRAAATLEPLAPSDDGAAIELARTDNNLASYLFDLHRNPDEVRRLYKQAIALYEDLLKRLPDSREYKVELANLCNNLAGLLNEAGEPQAADPLNQRAVFLLDDLARPWGAVATARAEAHALRGEILSASDSDAAREQFHSALELLEDLLKDGQMSRLPRLHEQFKYLVLDLADFRDKSVPGSASDLFSRAADSFVRMVSSMTTTGSLEEVKSLKEGIDEVAKEKRRLTAETRRGLETVQAALQRRLDGGR